MCSTLAAAALFLLVLPPLSSSVAAPGRPFGTAHKGCYRPPGTDGCEPWPMQQELTVFELAACPSKLCAMQHLWVGGNWPGYQHTVVRYYVDGEHTASVGFPLGLGHGSVMVDDSAPWSAGGVFGQTGYPSGIFNTYTIPFGAGGIRVTVELRSTPLPPSTESSRGVNAGATQSFWIVVRGHELVESAGSGTLPLPGSAMGPPLTARLRTVENRGVSVKRGEQLTLAKAAAVGDSAVFLVVLAVNSSSSLTFLEGCVRINDKGGNTSMLLSSGTEDYFLGTYYFNRGRYTNPVAGLTHKTGAGNGPATFSAYRLHNTDWLQLSDGDELTWRNWDPHGCELGGGAGPAVTVSSIAFVYDF